MILSHVTLRGWLASLGLLALLSSAHEAQAQEAKPDTVRFLFQVADDGKATGDELARLQAQLKELEAQLAKKKAEAAKIADAMKRAELDRAVAEGVAKQSAAAAKDQAKRALEAADKALANQGKGAVQAMRIYRVDAAEPAKPQHAIVLQKEGKQLVELPSNVVIAERDGKLIIEIPLAGAEKPKPTTPTPTKTPPSGVRLPGGARREPRQRSQNYGQS